MDRNRDDILQNIEAINKTIAENEIRMGTIRILLEDDKLNTEDILDLKIELQALEWENEEQRLDLGVLEEMLHILRINEWEDTRVSDEWEDRYSSWDEVFTGGDY